MLDEDAILMRGINLPPRMPPHRPPEELRRRWIDVVEILVSRGVEDPAHLSKLVDCPHRTAERWIRAAMRKFAQTQTEERRAARQEKLYRQANEVAMMAYMAAVMADKDEDKARYLRLVLQANSRMASLCGLDKLEIDVKAQVLSAHVDLKQELEAKGVDVSRISTIGDMTARALSSGE